VGISLKELGADIKECLNRIAENILGWIAEKHVWPAYEEDET